MDNDLLIESLHIKLVDQEEALLSLDKKLCSFENTIVELNKQLAETNSSSILHPIPHETGIDQTTDVHEPASETMAQPYQLEIDVLNDQQLSNKSVADLKKTIREQQKIISWQKVELNQRTKSINNLHKLLTIREHYVRKADSIDLERNLTHHAAQDPGPQHLKRGQQYRKGFINLGDQLTTVFGNHRSGWGYAVINLAPLNHEEGIYLDTFIERTFVWRTGEVVPTLQPWIGFIHVPPNVPEWFQSEQSNDAVFATDAWKKSYSYCKGLYTLSAYHRKILEKKLDVPINTLLHPTEMPYVKWQWDKFEKNTARKIVQIGWWLRKLHAIFELPKSDYRKVFLRVTKDAYFQKLFEQERAIRKADGKFTESMYDTVETVDYLSDEEYDKLISENIAFVDLYDSSANNVIIECIVRNAPLLVNPLEPVIEYLGPDYPFYFSSHEEAVAKANNLELIHRTHIYLKTLEIKNKLTGEYFLKSFRNSKIFTNL